MSRYSFLLLFPLLFACSGGSDILSTASNGEELSDAQRMAMTSLFFDAQNEKQLGNLYNARKLLAQVIEISPDNDAALYELARITAQQNEVSTALTYAQQAAALDSENPWYKRLLADLYLANGRNEDAVKAYERMVEIDPSNLELYYELSMIRYQTGDLDGAVKALQDLEKEVGYSEELFQQKHMLYMEGGKTDEAREHLSEALEEHPRDPMLLGMMAEMYMSEGNNEKGLEYFDRILETDPGNGMVHLNMYEYYMQAGETDKATESILKGFEDERIDLDSKMGILLSFYEASMSDEALRGQALRMCDKLVEVYPEDAKSHSIQGDFLLREQRYEEARASFYTAVDIDPSRAIIWSQILALDTELQDYEALRDDSGEAVDLFPASPDFYLLKGIAHNQLEEHTGAVKVLKGGKSMVIDDDAMLSDFYSNLGDAYNSLGKFADSDKAFEKALDIEPENIYVLNNYAYYLSLREERLERAAEFAARANELSPNSASFEDTYAWVLFQKGDYEKALLWIEKAMSNGGGQSGTVIEHYGDILFRLGRAEDAKAQWELASMFGDVSEDLPAKIESGRIPE